jgi:DNA-binding winged helix-turn-helix (wHTH) protein
MLDSLALYFGMPVPASSTDRVQFGVFELDLQRAELRKSGVKIKLQEQPLKILQILLENPGQIVGREELQKRIWLANTFVEFDQGLYSAMARLRDALGDSSDSPRFIETVARRGYRFIAPISGLPSQNVQSSAKVEEPKSLAFRRAIVSLLGGLLGGTLLLAGLLAFNLGGARNWLRLRTTQFAPLQLCLSKIFLVIPSRSTSPTASRTN